MFQSLRSSLFLSCVTLIYASTTFALQSRQAIATIPDHCHLREESFGFEMKDYAMDHHSLTTLDITVDFRYADQPVVQPSNYVDFVPIAEEIDRFLTEYPNEKDFWEIVNRNLTEKILNDNPAIDSLKIEMKVNAAPGDRNFDRYSTVFLTRENGCPLTN